MEEAAFPVPEKYWDMETFLPLEMKGKGRKISKTIWNHKLGRENKLDSTDFHCIIRDDFKIPVYPDYIQVKFQKKRTLGSME